MRKIRIMEHLSLGGVIQHEDGEGFAHGGWTAPYRTPGGLEARAGYLEHPRGIVLESPVAG